MAYQTGLDEQMLAILGYVRCTFCVAIIIAYWFMFKLFDQLNSYSSSNCNMNISLSIYLSTLRQSQQEQDDTNNSGEIYLSFADTKSGELVHDRRHDCFHHAKLNSEME